MKTLAQICDQLAAGNFEFSRQEVTMFQCHICGSTQAHTDLADDVFLIEGKRVLVEHIPVTRCARCGEITFSRETTEQVRRLVHSAMQPIKTVPLEVFAFA